MKLLGSGALSALLLASSGVQAIPLDPNDPNTIKSAAKTIATEMLSYYTGFRPGDTPGNLPDPYFWWEAGAMFGALVDYWAYTGDDEFNEKTTQALLHQVGDNVDYMPKNQSRTLGNDDQGFWGMAAMSAAERNYPNPPDDQPQWLALAQAVFNTQAPRWNTEQCGGGLKWQIFTFNNGYNYRNTISQGTFVNLAARLARYTGNETYSDWAERSWTWTKSVGLMDNDFHFYDGTDDTNNCTTLNHIQWTYNAGVHMHAAAFMYNHTESDVWKARLDGVISNIGIFFSPDVPNTMFEVACEGPNTCNTDQRSFKAYLSRWIGATMQVAPHTIPQLMPLLETSAVNAAKQCVGGAAGQSCGLKWTTNGVFDGSVGVGEQMAAMEVIQNLLAPTTAFPVTGLNGGTSVGDPNAGSQSNENPLVFDVVTTGDKVGAGFLTTLVLVFILGGAWWMIS